MTTGQVIFGLILIVLGILLILNNIDLIDFDFGVIWPLILVFAGLYIIIKEYEIKRIAGRIIRKGEQVE